MAAAKAFFRSAKAVTGVTPDRVTTDGHDSYPRAIRTELGQGVRHRTSRYKNNRLEQDHRGLKGRYRPMRGFKCPRSAARFCRAYDELRNFLRPRSRHNQHVPADRRDCSCSAGPRPCWPSSKPPDRPSRRPRRAPYSLARGLTEPPGLRPALLTTRPCSSRSWTSQMSADCGSPHAGDTSRNAIPSPCTTSTSVGLSCSGCDRSSRLISPQES